VYVVRHQETGSTTSDVMQRHRAGAGTLPPHVRSAGEPVYQLTAGLYGHQRAELRQGISAASHGPVPRQNYVTLVSSLSHRDVVRANASIFETLATAVSMAVSERLAKQKFSTYGLSS